MRQEFADQLAIVIAGGILLLAVIFAVYQSGNPGLAEEGQGDLPLIQPASRISHPLVGYENCQACHSLGAQLPFPRNHEGWPDVYCATCHAPSVLE